MKRRHLIAASGAALAGVATRSRAQAWPDRPIRMVIPYPPGGGTDIAGRIVAAKLGDILGQPVVVDNRGGGGGIIGTRVVGQSPADGYTLLFNGTLSVLRDNFDPRTVVTHNVRVLATHNLLVLNEHVPSKTVPDFIAYAKERPGQLNHGTAGPLSSQHLAAVMFDLYAGTKIENVHYRGTGPSIAGLLTNEVQLMFGSMSAVLPLIQEGKIRALATSSGERSQMLKELPTVGEFVPNYASELTYSISTPNGTPRAITARIDEVVRKMLADRPTVEMLSTRGFENAYMAEDTLAAQIESDVQKWGDVVRRAGLDMGMG